MVGTRFNLFVQPPFDHDQARPEVVIVSSPAGSLRAGPSDSHMRVVAPIGKARPYGVIRGPLGTPFLHLPPWRGRTARPAMPDQDGHFDHYEPGEPGFEAAHVFGCVRFALDVWENYLGQKLRWHFGEHFRTLEICLLPAWGNAQFGYGFLEVGSTSNDSSARQFSMDFDIIAHEVGHAIIYSILGVPAADAEYPEYLGFQEAFADCVSLVAAMHFQSVLEGVLSETRGNLYLPNRIARFSELAPHRQIRLATNRRTMRDFVAGWRDEHDLSEPLTGAIFDIMVDIFQDLLVERGLMTRKAELLAEQAERDAADMPLLQEIFDRAYAFQAAGFREALVSARDVMGRYLADCLWRLQPDFFNYGDVARALLVVDQEQSAGRYSTIIRANFRRRGIGRLHAGALQTGCARCGHAWSARTLLPGDHRRLPRMSFRERYLLSQPAAGVQ